MAKEKFGVAVDEEVVQEVDELVAEYDDLGVSGSVIVKAILQHSFNPRGITLNRCEESLFGTKRALSNRF